MASSVEVKESEANPTEKHRWYHKFNQKGIQETRKTSGRWDLLFFGILCIIIAGVFYLLDFWAKANGYKTWAEIFHHLSTAFIVALVSIVGIEINAKRRAERELARFVAEFESYRKLISENVFEAVLGRIVPEQLTQEIHEILRIPFVKLSTQYIIRFSKPYPGMSADYCVVRRDLSFKVKNVTAEPQVFQVRSAYTSDENLKSANWGERPFHLALIVNRKPVPPEMFLTEDKHVMDYPVKLAPRKEARIFIRSEEPMRLEANRSFYYQSTPVDGLEVIIDNSHQEVIKEIEVQMHHPGRQGVLHESYRNRYILRRAFLPGQGFEAIWRKTEEVQNKLAAVRQMELLAGQQDQPK